ncbi:hypothetical protein A2U01_0076033, partial [Trifolium medium]|nr:hypothetical protein [Trifolium medium]
MKKCSSGTMEMRLEQSWYKMEEWSWNMPWEDLKIK